MRPVEEFLRNAAFFQGVEDRDLAALATTVRTQTYGCHELLAQLVDPARTISFVEQGGVRLFRLTVEGRQLTVSTRHAGEYFWQNSTYTKGGPRGCIEALSDGTIAHHFERREFDVLVARYPVMAATLIGQLSFFLGEAYDRLEDAALRPPDIQLAHTLVRLAGGEQPVVTATHEEIATLMGITRERVTKLLGRLQALRLVACERRWHRIFLLRPEHLKDL